MYLANKLLDSLVKTFITYNKGQTWDLLPAPAADVAGNNLHCILVSLSLWAGSEFMLLLMRNEAYDIYHSSNVSTSSAVLWMFFDSEPYARGEAPASASSS